MKRNFRASLRVLLCGSLVVLAVLGSTCDTGNKRKLKDNIEAKNPSCENGKQMHTPLNLALRFGPLTFNPLVDSSPDTLTVTRNLFATLLDYQYDKNRPDDTGLASAVNAEGDGQTYTVQLRKARFSDGTALKAEDVVYSYNAAMNIADSTLSNLLKFDDKQVDVTAPDEKTVKIKFPVAISSDLAKLIMARVPIMDRVSTEAAAKTSGGPAGVLSLETPPEKIVTSGPYKVKSRSANEIVLVANEYYWKQDSSGTLLPFYDEVKYQLNLDRKTQSEKFAKGELDACNSITGEQFKSMSGNNKITVADKGTSMRVWALVLNTRIDRQKVDPNKTKHFFIPGFRWGLSQATNRDRMIQTVAGGAGKPAYNLISPGNATWFESSAKSYPYNMEAAKKWMTEIKYNLVGTELKDPINQAVRFTLLCPKDPEAQAIAKLLTEDYKALGVAMKTDEVPVAQWWKYLNQGVFDATLVEITPDFPDPAFITPYVVGNRLYTVDGPVGNFDLRKGNWYNEVTRAMNSALKIKSTADRKEQYKLVQQKWGEQIPLIYLFSENMLVGAKTGLGNLRFTNIDPGATWNIEELFVK
ncbi:MAG: ABC transporter substrate-binding protein [Blastocatellia bacterium]|nr:ABC transporter substrate-binding protein [Blastocatellia bacterium]